MIDSHAHLDDLQYDADREKVIERAFNNGIEKIVNIGAGLASSARSIEIAARYENIFSTVGLHPHYFMKHGSWSQEHKQKLENLASLGKVVAIGEIGLDYHRHEGGFISKREREFQKEGFIFQLGLARKLRLPVVIHCRGARLETPGVYRESNDAYEDVFGILEDFSDLKIIFHSFGGGLEFAKKILKSKNIFFSLAGNITYNKPDSEIFKVIRFLPLEKILIETDCPYLTPVPMRGVRNEPIYVKFVAKKIAEIKNIDEEKVVSVSTRNAEKFFGI